MTYGTNPNTLHRHDAIQTSVDAAHETDTTRWERLVHQVIKTFPAGCISDEVLAQFPHGTPYSSVTARYSALIDKDLIRRTGEKRKGRSGRGQSVMVAAAQQGVLI